MANGAATLLAQSTALGAATVGPTVQNFGWLLAEDAALKAKLKGLFVDDVNNATRPVPVRYRLPENELADMTFPTIIIEHAGINIDHEREHRGTITLPYSPVNLPPLADAEIIVNSPYMTEFPIPYNLDYQVTVYARFYQHTLNLVGQLAQWDKLPARNGFLAIPQDGTVRRLDLMAGPAPDVDRDVDGKRIFKSIYAIRVSTELLAADVAIVGKALLVGLNLSLLSTEYFD